MIAKTLLNASSNGYTLISATPGSEEADLLVKKLVDKASQNLFLLLENIPAKVFEARLRAKECCFQMSCEDLVGRLLATLSATVPKNGKSLEIGTGTGVGTAWICTGLRERTDVEVITIEVDPFLHQAVLGGSWPAYIKFICGDAKEMLDNLEEFNLVFADASPVKYGGNIESTFRLLAAGGILVIDDLRANRKLNETQCSDIENLRRKIMANPNLQVVELQWATGVIITTNCCVLLYPSRSICNLPSNIISGDCKISFLNLTKRLSKITGCRTWTT